ncbi:MAG: TetR/AcrR family transcriptional regulator [Gemmataceae bacterium]
MGRRRGDVGKRRREEIVEAAVAIIAEEGLPRLSLSSIEARAGMSRGQLTYYFPAKEDILVAVFDRMIATMHRRTGDGQGPPGCALAGTQGWEHVQAFLAFMILHPPDVPEFHQLQVTFLSQVGHRADFRQRLAQLFELWRSHMAEDFTREGAGRFSARTLASFVQAVLHGLAVQRVADPDAYDREEMRALVLHLLGAYLGKAERPRRITLPAAPAAAGRPNPRTRREPQ